jgi:transposase
MHKIKEVIRLKAAGLSLRPIARCVQLSLGVVAKYAKRSEALGLGWPLPEELSDDALTQLILGASEQTEAGANPFVLPGWSQIHQELKRKGVTLQLLWQEYQDCQGRAAYGYSRFCRLYRVWVGTLKLSMRQTHRAGEKLFIDYCGPTVPIYGPCGDIACSAQIFVAVLGASSYTYAEATLTQQLHDWLASHVRAFEFIGGSPAIVVPDNLKSGVTKACRYEPQINQSYAELAAHYHIAVIPARPYRPQDKAKVEVGVQVVERWILAVLRHRRFFSLIELNSAIRELLTQLNAKPFKKLPGSRLSAFESLDKPALRPLPAERYEYAKWKKVRASIDYHVEFEGHFYSVPHALVGRELEVRATVGTVECLYKSQRVASHLKSAVQGAYTTVLDHMPHAHRAHLEWTPNKLLAWADSIGCATREVVQYQFTHKPHPEMGYRSCLGLLSLARRYGHGRLEAACQRAVAIASPTRKSVASILQANLDQTPMPNTPETTDPLVGAHDNVRGETYYK